MANQDFVSDELDHKISPVKDFHCLPNEMMFMVFEKMDISALTALAMTSRTLFDKIYGFIESGYGIDFLHVRVKKALTDSMPRKAKDIGKFFNCITTFDPRDKKLPFICHVLLGVKYSWKSDVIALRSYFLNLGHIIHQFLIGWGNDELQLMHNIMDTFTGMKDMLFDVLNAPLALLSEKEVIVSMYYKAVYYCCVPPAKRGFWLNFVLYQLTPKLQAKFLFMMFSPITEDGYVTWSVFSISSDFMSDWLKKQRDIALFELGNVMLILYTARILVLNDILMLIQRIINFPQPWCDRNLCRLLLHCRKDIFTAFIKLLYAQGFAADLSLLIVTTAAGVLHRVPDIFFNDLAHTAMEALQTQWENSTARENFLRNFQRYTCDLVRNGFTILQREAARVMRRVFQENYPIPRYNFRYMGYYQISRSL